MYVNTRRSSSANKETTDVLIPWRTKHPEIRTSYPVTPTLAYEKTWLTTGFLADPAWLPNPPSGFPWDLRLPPCGHRIASFEELEEYMNRKYKKPTISHTIRRVASALKAADSSSSKGSWISIHVKLPWIL
jgi:hypothetical protein